MAVRKLWPQLTTKLSRGTDGLLAVKRSTIWSGGSDICDESVESVGGIVMAWKAERAVRKKASGLRPEQVPCACHS